MQELRAAGIAADMDHNARSLKAQMKYADKAGAEYVALIGGRRAAEGLLQASGYEGKPGERSFAGKVGRSAEVRIWRRNWETGSGRACARRFQKRILEKV